MGHYVSVGDVRGDIPQVVISATSRPNEGQVDEFIDRTEAFVDSILTSIGYTTPIVAASAVIIVKEIVMAGVIARTLNARDVGVRDPNIGGGPFFQNKFDATIKRLQDREDPLALLGTVLTSPKLAITPQSPAAMGWPGDDHDDDDRPAFRVGQVF